ncbi:hypothetical protein C8Q77DRAFT_1158143 [Trametes polyzona]|nr:hypothetical protein C8Q77DRAFT_1158143 [Trametes polyzona]
MVVGGIMLTAALGILANDSIFDFDIMPVNSPPPVNCFFTANIKGGGSIDRLNIISIVFSIVGLSLVTIVTWRKTRTEWKLSEDDVFLRPRPTLSEVMFNYGMAYFCVLLTLNIANSTVQLLWITEPGIGIATSYIGGFVTPITTILTSRLMLGIFAANARAERGGASTARSMSVNLNSGIDFVGFSSPGFVTSYGGPAHSFLDDDYEEQHDGVLGTTDNEEPGLRHREAALPVADVLVRIHAPIEEAPE